MPDITSRATTTLREGVTIAFSSSGMFASDGLYTCDWQSKNKMGKSVGKGNGTWGKSLFCSKTDRPEEYCRGTCSFTAPLPKDRGIYNYTIMVLGPPNGVFSNEILAEPSVNADMTETPPDEKPADEMDGDGRKKYIIVGVSISLLIICAVAATVIFSRRSLRRQRSRRMEIQNRNSGDIGRACAAQSSRKSDSSLGTATRAAGNRRKKNESTPRSSSEASEITSSNPNHSSTVLQEVDIQAYTDLHTRDFTYAATSSKKDTHTYMELPISTRCDSPQPSCPSKPSGEGGRSSAVYANQEESQTEEENGSYSNAA